MGVPVLLKQQQLLVMVTALFAALLLGSTAVWMASHGCQSFLQASSSAAAWRAVRPGTLLRFASAAADSQPPPPPAATRLPPITVLHSVDWLVSAPVWLERGCMHAGQELDCSYHFAPNMGAGMAATIERATAVLQNVCQPPPVQVQHPVVRVLLSLESAANYPCIDAQAADIEVSYRGCSQVWWPFLWMMQPKISQRAADLFSQPLPSSQKKTAIAYMNSNCSPRNNRTRVMKELGALLKARHSRLEVHSYGACDNNMGAAASADLNEGIKHNKKIDLFRQYKFCVAMENSAARDYVSEKLYDAFTAGCVPLYMGAPNVNEYIPSPSAIINYDTMGGSVQALADRLEQLAADEEAYEAMLAWKQWPHHRYPPRLRTMLENNDTTMCHLCRYLAAHPPGTPQQGVPCSANTSWSDA